MKPEIIGFGALNVDLIYQIDWRSLNKRINLSLQPGEERVLAPEEFTSIWKAVDETGHSQGKSGGGQAANTMVALSQMGFPCGYIGRVGNDKAGELLYNSMQNVDKSHIRRQGQSGIALCLVDNSGERTILLQPGANDELEAEADDLAYLNQAKLAYFSSFVGDKPLDAQIKAAKSLEAGTKLALDPGELYAGRGLQALEALLNKTTLLFISEEELALLTGKRWPGGADKLLDFGPDILVCKRGSKGAAVAAYGERWEYPPEKVDVLDCIGAGDVLAAGFIAGRLRGLPIPDCLDLGQKAAAGSITGFGRQCYPDRTFLQNYFRPE